MTHSTVPTFITRSDFVIWAASSVPSIGSFVFVDNLGYRYTGVNIISDLPGWEPLGVTTPIHFGAPTDGTDASDAINAACAYDTHVYFPSGTYGLSSSIHPQAGAHLYGDTKDATVLIMLPTAPDTIPGIAITGDSCIIERMAIDGNKSARLTATAGSGISISSSSNTVRNCILRYWPNSGILAGDNTQTGLCNENTFEGNIIISNDGVGLSQYSVRQSKIINNRFGSNGKENLTIDVGSFNCIVTGNHFYKHLGGCGNVGWDLSDNSIFSSNIIDDESSVIAAVGTRNGICFNGAAGFNLRAVISGNVIVNCVEAGILIKHNTYNGGQAAITGNTFGNNGVDVILDGPVGKVKLRGNIYSDIPFTTINTTNNLISLDTGDINWSYRQATSHLVPVSNVYATLTEDTMVALENATFGGGSVVVGVGGIYQMTASIQISGLVAAGVTQVVAKIVASGLVRSINVPIQSTQDMCTAVIDVIGRITPGSCKVQYKCIGGSGNITIMGGLQTYFMGSYVA